MQTLLAIPGLLTEMEEPEHCFRNTLCIKALTTDDKRCASGYCYLFPKYWRNIPTLPTSKPFKVAKIGDLPNNVLTSYVHVLINGVIPLEA